MVHMCSFGSGLRKMIGVLVDENEILARVKPEWLMMHLRTCILQS